MIEKAFKTVVTFVNAVLSLLGLSFLAGAVAGAVIEGDGKKIEFRVGGENVIDDDATTEETTSEETVEEVTDED